MDTSIRRADGVEGGLVRLLRTLGAFLAFFLALNGLALAHSTEEMDAIRLSLTTWAVGLLNGDTDQVASVLHESMTTNEGWDRSRYLLITGGSLEELPVTRVFLEFAYHEPVQSDIRVAPVVVYQSNDLLKFAYSLTFRLTAKGWKIIHISSDVPLPPELLAADLPEQHTLYPVAIRLRDQTSRRPVSARVHVRDQDGAYWPPEGHQKNIPIGWRQDVGRDVLIDGRVYAYVEPDFVLPVPLGRYEIEVWRGIEYEPETMEFEVTTSQVPTVDVELRRWSNVQELGWYSGDTHVHFLDARTAFLEAEGEDLNVINVLATKWGELITNVEDFTGAPDRVSKPGRIVYVNEETRHDYLGHTVLLNLKRLIYPLSWGEAGDAGVPRGVDYPPMAVQADRAHEQGGFVSWAHFPGPTGELAIDVALGKIDSVDVITWGDPRTPREDRPSSFDVWYGFLNCGFKLPATAGTDKMWNTQVVGIPRTYVKVKSPFSYEGWLEGIREGRTFVTTGPILTFAAAGKQLGETISAVQGDVVPVIAKVKSHIPVESIEIVQRGRVVARKDNPDQLKELTLEANVTVSGSSWIAARAVSSEILPYQKSWYVLREGIPLIAHTSPFYIDVEGSRQTSPEDAALFLEWIDKTLSWLETEATLLVEEERKEMEHLFRSAREVYLVQLED